jgi:hypothetical protein
MLVPVRSARCSSVRLNCCAQAKPGNTVNAAASIAPHLVILETVICVLLSWVAP